MFSKKDKDTGLVFNDTVKGGGRTKVIKVKKRSKDHPVLAGVLVILLALVVFVGYKYVSVKGSPYPLYRTSTITVHIKSENKALKKFIKIDIDARKFSVVDSTGTVMLDKDGDELTRYIEDKEASKLRKIFKHSVYKDITESNMLQSEKKLFYKYIKKDKWYN